MQLGMKFSADFRPYGFLFVLCDALKKSLMGLSSYTDQMDETTKKLRMDFGS